MITLVKDWGHHLESSCVHGFISLWYSRCHSQSGSHLSQILMPKILYQCLVSSPWGKSQQKSDSIKECWPGHASYQFCVGFFYFVNYLWFQFFEISISKEPPVLAFWKNQNYKAIDWFHLFQKLMNQWFSWKNWPRTVGFGKVLLLYAGNISKPISLSAENNSYEIKEPPYNWKEFGAISNSTQHWC